MRKQFLKFKYKKGKLFSRKGMGMELALLVLLAVFACSTLLVSSAMFGKNTLMREEKQVITRLALDELAEKALAGKLPEDTGDYTVEQTTDGWVINDTNGNSLEVKIKNNVIIAWEYK